MYYRLTIKDCLSVATESELKRLQNIHAFYLIKQLADRWCDSKGYKLGGYLGDDKWDTHDVP